MSDPKIAQLHLRRIQAETLFGVYSTLKTEYDDQTALDVIRRTVEEDAARQGRLFAQSAPDGPCLEHFVSVLDRWKDSGALDIADITLTSNTLKFTVTRCGYAEAYRLMGIPPALSYVLSCSRDATFARGYMPSLIMERSKTIAQGNPVCEFRFISS